MPTVWLRPLQLLVELFLPDGCRACGTYLPMSDGPWCAACALKIGRAAQTDYCPRCGITSQQANQADGCPLCMNTPWPIDGVARVGEYSGTLRELIHRYKFRKQQLLDRPLGQLLVSAVQRHPWHVELDGLVPVPTSWKSRREYGCSPATSIAQQMSRDLRVPMLPILRERGKKLRQVGLDAAKRAKNVRGVYEIAPSARPAGGIFCIVDDVSTSGATLREIATVLRKANATRVYAAILAKTPTGHDDAHEF